MKSETRPGSEIHEGVLDAIASFIKDMASSNITIAEDLNLYQRKVNGGPPSPYNELDVDASIAAAREIGLSSKQIGRALRASLRNH